MSAFLAGDRVEINRHGGGSVFGAVAKVTPSGQVVVRTGGGGEYRFSAEGREIGPGASWDRRYLHHAAPPPEQAAQAQQRVEEAGRLDDKASTDEAAAKAAYAAAMAAVRAVRDHAAKLRDEAVRLRRTPPVRP